ncbi:MULTISPECIES: signal peptidase II [Bacteria]
MTEPSPAPELSAGPRKPLNRPAAIAIIATLAVVALAADQLSKFFALQNLTPGDPVQILGEFLVFVLVFNPGAAFSLGESVTWVFTIALAAVAVAIVWLMFTRVRSRLWAVALGLLLGGVLGNLTDRLLRDPGFPVGHVVDFISTPWMMPAIYNVADIFIVCDMIGIALLVLLGLHMDGTRERREDKADASTVAASEASDSVSSDTVPSEPVPSEPVPSDSVPSEHGPVSIVGVGVDRDSLFPVADPDVGAPRRAKEPGDDDPTRA